MLYNKGACDDNPSIQVGFILNIESAMFQLILIQTSPSTFIVWL